jgi:hypothetical protein
MNSSETYRYAEGRRSRRKPFHLHDRRTLESDTSRDGHPVNLTKARRAAKYREDKCDEVTYVTWRRGPTWRKRWHKIVIQSPSFREAELVFTACLHDESTGSTRHKT